MSEIAREQILQPSSEDFKRIFVGPKYDVYSRKWSQLSSWNWSAFLGGIFWLAYRKMYAYALGFGGLILLETVLEPVFHIPESVSRAVTIAVGVVSGMQGNAWYKRHVDSKIAQIAPGGEDNPTVRQQLAKRGGTSLGMAFAVLGALIVVVTLTVYFSSLAAPAATAN